jgi:multiple sugar transport system ATP-binding protein
VASIILTAIRKSFGTTPVLHGVSLEIRDGEFLTLLGPSGCGKTTLLRIVAGIEDADSGTVAIDGRDVGARRPKDRDIAMVFQSYALYPYMTVERNIALPLEMRRLSVWQRAPLVGRLMPGARAIRAGIAGDARAVAEGLGLGALLGRRPAQLSGGQRQRVALARAMVRRPAAFLMDEPLSNLDARLRAEARAEIAALHRSLGATILYVTHDQAEAMTMSDRVAVLEHGRLLQVAPPRALYDDPADLRVARFVGSPPMSILAAELRGDGAVTLQGRPLGIGVAAPAGALQLGLRAEALVPDRHGLPASVRLVEQLGAEALVHLAMPGASAAVIMRLDPDRAAALRPGEQCPVAILPGRALVFGADGRRLAARPALSPVAAHG